MSVLSRLVFAGIVALAVGCGSSRNSGTAGDAGNGDASLTDGGCTGLCTDAPPSTGMCMPGNAQCSNCIDDDGDGKIDGFDLQCAGPLDDDESSFATGIPGDNIDEVMQDCFFDGNSGAGNDGCNVHVCCILGATSKAECPIGANRFEVTDCPPPLGTMPLSDKCTRTCGKLAPPGCDCFGCCTVCDPAFPNDATKCYDIALNPTTSPGCTEATLSDPNSCRRCTKNAACGNTTCNASDPASCVLCPGQDPSSLPQSCTGSTCPEGTTACDAQGACGPGTYCSNGCCIGALF